MNKINFNCGALAMVLIAFCSIALAKPYSGDFEVVFNFETNLKHKTRKSLTRKNKRIYLNGVALSSEKILLNREKINYLVMGEPHNPHNPHNEAAIKCVKGEYELVVAKGGEKRLEKGCVGSKRFGKLATAFQSF